MMRERPVRSRQNRYRAAIVGALTVVAILAGACTGQGSQAHHRSRTAHGGDAANVTPVMTIVTTPPVTAPPVTAPPVTAPPVTAPPAGSGTTSDTTPDGANPGDGTLAPNFFDGPPGCNPPAC